MKDDDVLAARIMGYSSTMLVQQIHTYTYIHVCTIVHVRTVYLTGQEKSEACKLHLQPAGMHTCELETSKAKQDNKHHTPYCTCTCMSHLAGIL